MCLVPPRLLLLLSETLWRRCGSWSPRLTASGALRGRRRPGLCEDDGGALLCDAAAGLLCDAAAGLLYTGLLADAAGLLADAAAGLLCTGARVGRFAASEKWSIWRLGEKRARVGWL
jgi:hypothetical protein